MRSTDGSDKSKAKKRQDAAADKPKAEGRGQPKIGGKAPGTSGKSGLSIGQQRLLENQQAMLQRVRQHSLVGATYEPPAQVSAAKTREIARKVGIWTADGKLASTYKK